MTATDPDDRADDQPADRPAVTAPRGLLMLWRDTLGGLRGVARTEAQAWRAEIDANLRRLQTTALCLVVGAFLLLPALLLLMAAAVLALAQLIGAIWASLLLALLCLLLALLLMGVARYRLIRQPILPHHALVRMDAGWRALAGGRAACTATTSTAKTSAAKTSAAAKSDEDEDGQVAD